MSERKIDAEKKQSEMVDIRSLDTYSLLGLCDLVSFRLGDIGVLREEVRLWLKETTFQLVEP
jgi:hypothetical protein